MCCLFTCCGWMIDLIQRLWTFTMSCCISSAICCALVTASMSGIALGYNYSLAEYIDLKETNVSVYLKRGIFDDEIGDDMDWRRSGHLPVAGHIGEHNLRTGAPEDDTTPVRSGRRLDDSIYESDDRNKFEGSLMKLTAKPPAPSKSADSETTVNIDQIISKYSMGSVDQLKAIQTLINMRKAADARQRIGKGETKSTENIIDERYLPQMAVYPGGNVPGRRLLPHSGPGIQPPTPGDSARFAVPDEGLNAPGQWKFPKYPPEAFTAGRFEDYDARPTYPKPVTLRSGPVRPTRPKPTNRPKPSLTTGAVPVIIRHEKEPNIPKSIDEEMDTFKEKLLLDKFDVPSMKDDNFMKKMKGPKGNEDDYEDAIKGVPIRKKREVNDHSEIKNINNQDINKRDSLYSAQELFNNLLSKEINKSMENKLESIVQRQNITDAHLSTTVSSQIILKLLNVTAI